MGRAAEIEFDWPGQGLAIDLADTVLAIRPGVSADLLEDAGRLDRWLELERPWLRPAGEDAPERLDDFRGLRDSIRTLFFAAARREQLPEAAVRAVNGAAAAAPFSPRLDAAPDGPPRTTTTTTADPTTAALAEVARSAIEILGGPDRERLRVCEAPSCGMFFLASRPKQVWCRQLCGNRARVARHYHRTKTSRLAT